MVKRALIATAAVLVAACNPYSDSLPPALCRSPTWDCRPGEICADGHCLADAQVHVRARSSTGGPIAIAVLATPDGESIADGGAHARLLAELVVLDATVAETTGATFDSLPRLRSVVVAWDASAERPCRGVATAVSVIDPHAAHELSLYVNEPWEADCLPAFRELVTGDRALFARRRAPGDEH